MPVGHGAWKASEPLSDPDQLLSIAKHDPNVSRWLVSATPSSGLCTLCPTPPIRGTRGGTLRRGPDEGSHRHEHIFFNFIGRVFLGVYGSFSDGEQPAARIKDLAAIKALNGAIPIV